MRPRHPAPWRSSAAERRRRPPSGLGQAHPGAEPERHTGVTGVVRDGRERRGDLRRGEDLPACLLPRGAVLLRPDRTAAYGAEQTAFRRGPERLQMSPQDGDQDGRDRHGTDRALSWIARAVVGDALAPFAWGRPRVRGDQGQMVHIARSTTGPPPPARGPGFTGTRDPVRKGPTPARAGTSGAQSRAYRLPALGPKLGPCRVIYANRSKSGVKTSSFIRVIKVTLRSFFAPQSTGGVSAVQVRGVRRCQSFPQGCPLTHAQVFAIYAQSYNSYPQGVVDNQIGVRQLDCHHVPLTGGEAAKRRPPLQREPPDLVPWRERSSHDRTQEPETTAPSSAARRWGGWACVLEIPQWAVATRSWNHRDRSHCSGSCVCVPWPRRPNRYVCRGCSCRNSADANTVAGRTARRWVGRRAVSIAGVGARQPVRQHQHSRSQRRSPVPCVPRLLRSGAV